MPRKQWKPKSTAGAKRGGHEGGPFSRRKPDGGLEMTEEGQAFLLAWLVDWPEPAKLLNKAHRNIYNAWMLANWKQNQRGTKYENLNQTCLVACCKAMLRYDPANSKFSTYASTAMYFEVRQELDRKSKEDGRKHRTVVVSGDAPHGKDEASVFMEVVDRYVGIDTAFESEEAFEKLVEVATELPPQEIRHATKWEYVFEKHFRDGVSQAELSKELKVTRSCVTQIVERGISRIRKAIAEGQL